MVELYVIEYRIDDRLYSANIPARSWCHAAQIANSFGAIVVGSNVHEVSAVPISQLMDFCGHVCEEPPKWKYNAEEQLESFLSIGWPKEPSELV